MALLLSGLLCSFLSDDDDETPSCVFSFFVVLGAAAAAAAAAEAGSAVPGALLAFSAAMTCGRYKQWVETKDGQHQGYYVD